MERDLGKLKNGQEIWVKVEEGSNASRYIDKTKTEEWIFKGEVIKAGRKYITVKFKKNNTNSFIEKKFNVEDDYREHYTCGGADYKLYLSKQSIFDEVESETIYTQITSVFNGWKNNNKFSLDQLRKIKDIVEDNKEIDTNKLIYHYSLSSYWYNKNEQDNVYMMGTITHEKKFTDKEFDEICKKELEILQKENNCITEIDLEKVLIEKYKFKDIDHIASFEFCEDEEE